MAHYFRIKGHSPDGMNDADAFAVELRIKDLIILNNIDPISHANWRQAANTLFGGHNGIVCALLSDT